MSAVRGYQQPAAAAQSFTTAAIATAWQSWIICIFVTHGNLPQIVVQLACTGMH
jgi:hypothetical protein